MKTKKEDQPTRKKREVKQITREIYKDQFDHMQAIEEETGETSTSQIRKALDVAFKLGAHKP